MHRLAFGNNRWHIMVLVMKTLLQQHTRICMEKKKRKQDDTRWGVLIILAGRLSEDLDVCLESAARWADIHKADLFDLLCAEWICLVLSSFLLSISASLFLTIFDWICVFIITIDDDGLCSFVRCKYMLYQNFPDNRNGEKAEILRVLTNVIWAAICLSRLLFSQGPPFSDQGESAPYFVFWSSLSCFYKR